MAKRREGAFFEIDLPNGKFAYGRILGKASYAFYDIYSNKKINDLELIKKSKILFINSVYKYAITKDHWKIVGISELEPELKVLPMEFIQDPLDLSRFEIYNPNTGQIESATKEQCLKLEKAAVWEPTHIEDRIVDYYEHRPNVWAESLKIKDG